MEILDAILKEQKSQKAEIEKLTLAVTEVNKKVDNPKPVQVDTREIANAVARSMKEPISDLNVNLKTANQEMNRSINRLPSSIPVNGVMGFTSTKSMVAYLLFLVIPIAVSTYIYFKYQENPLGQRLDRANQRIEATEAAVSTWIEGNPRDSQSFMKEINVKELGRTY